MGDAPSHSTDTPCFLGTLSKTWGETGRSKEEQVIPDSGCTQDVIPASIARDHGLKIKPVDPDEPEMMGFGDHRVTMIVQVSFYFQACRFKRL